MLYGDASPMPGPVRPGIFLPYAMKRPAGLVPTGRHATFAFDVIPEKAEIQTYDYGFKP
jgi:hypothetical protein